MISVIQRRISEGMALVGGPLVGMLNYCTAAKFEGFEAAESEHIVYYKPLQTSLEIYIHTLTYIYIRPIVL